jgi:ATP-dependent RNA circularization protein (DNA/RNA ligase family)
MPKIRGQQISTYFEAGFANNINRAAENLGISAQDYIRLAVKNFMEDEAVTEVEKLQIFNIKAFKFIANKLSHLELLTAIQKSNNKKEANKYDSILGEIKNFNQEQINEYIKETL